jgi:hypothetical protein
MPTPAREQTLSCLWKVRSLNYVTLWFEVLFYRVKRKNYPSVLKN